MAKKIEDKKLKHVKFKEGDNTYKDLIEYTVRHVPDGGLTFKRIEDGLRIIEQCEKMEFEDADFNNLKVMLQGVKFGQGNVSFEVLSELNEFSKYINKL